MCHGRHKQWHRAAVASLFLGVLFAGIALSISWGSCTGGFVIIGSPGEPTAHFYLTSVEAGGSRSWSDWTKFADGPCYIGGTLCANCSAQGAGTIVVATFAFVALAGAVFFWCRAWVVRSKADRKHALVGVALTVFASLIFTAATFVFKNQCLNQYPVEFCDHHGPGFGLLLAAAVILIVSAGCRVMGIFQQPEPDDVMASPQVNQLDTKGVDMTTANTGAWNGPGTQSSGTSTGAYGDTRFASTSIRTLGAYSNGDLTGV